MTFLWTWSLHLWCLSVFAWQFEFPFSLKTERQKLCMKSCISCSIQQFVVLNNCWSDLTLQTSQWVQIKLIEFCTTDKHYLSLLCRLGWTLLNCKKLAAMSQLFLVGRTPFIAYMQPKGWIWWRFGKALEKPFQTSILSMG